MENLKEFWLKEPESIGCDIQYCSPHLTSSHLEIYNSGHSSRLQPSKERSEKGELCLFVGKNKPHSAGLLRA